MLGEGKNPNSFITIFLHRIIFFFLTSSRVFSSQHFSSWPLQEDRS
jgi:hypothetical protein